MKLAEKFAQNPLPLNTPGEVPLGTIIDWFWFSQGFPTPDGLPKGFELCDGSPVKDPTSPFFNQGFNKPNLLEKFVMGVAVGDRGRTGGKNDIPQDLGQTIGQPPRNMTLRTDRPAKNDGFAGEAGAVNFQAAGDALTNHFHSLGLGNFMVHDHGSENRPAFCGVVKLMRVA